MITDRLRLMRIAARIPRVHTRPPIHKQTVGEHTFGVLAIIHEVLGVDASPNLLRAALYHDAPEAITGDVPAPAKWDSTELSGALSDLEDQIVSKYSLPTSRLDLSEFEERVLRYADLMELALFAIEEVNTGNRGMRKVGSNALNHLATNGLVKINQETSRLYYLAYHLLSTEEALNQWEDR